MRAPVLGTGRYDYPGPGRPVEFVRVHPDHFVGALKRYEAKLERNSDRLRDAKFRPELGDIILYNPTASLEQGFYIRAGQPVERGVVVTVPVHTSRLAYVREGYVRAAGDRFLKRVAAIEGDRVCSGDGRITINDAEAARVFETDPAGMALPSWSGCITLKGGEVFLLGDAAGSFDGRYWGVTSAADVEGTWRRFP